MGGRAPSSFESVAIRIRRGAFARRLGGAALSVYVVVLVLHAWIAVPRTALLVTVVLLPALLGVSALVSLGFARARAGRVTANGTDLRIAAGSSSIDVRPGDVGAAYLVSDADSVRVEIEVRGGDRVSIRTAFDDGRALLHAAGLDPAHHALRMPLGGSGSAVLVCTLLAIFAVFFCAPLAVWMPRNAPAGLLSIVLAGAGVALVPVLAFAAWAASPQTIVVGTDGISLEPWSRRFVPWAMLDDVVVRQENLVLWLRDGTSVRVHSSEMRGARAAVVLDRIREGIASFRPGRGLARLDPEGLTPGEWLESLRRSLVHEAGYRQTAVAKDEILAVLEDGGAAGARRVAAAVALVAAGESDRVRTVVAACADEALRDALSRACDPSLGPGAFAQILARVAR